MLEGAIQHHEDIKNVDKQEKDTQNPENGCEEDEAWKADLACGGPSVRPKQTDASLLTFSRQKLAELSCNYNPKCCNHCGKVLKLDTMIKCQKCQIAQFCSQKCRKKNWRRHSQDCEEIQRLKVVIEKEERKPAAIPDNIAEQQCELRDSGHKVLRARLRGEPKLLEPGLEYELMCVWKDQIIAAGRKRVYLTPLYSPYLGFVHFDSEISFFPQQRFIAGLCLVKTNNVQYIAASFLSPLTLRSEIDLLSFPPRNGKSVVNFRSPFHYGELCFYEKNLLASNRTKNTIDEFKVGVKLLKPTGLKIPDSLEVTSTIMQSMCVLKEYGEKKIILLYWDGRLQVRGINCIDYYGNVIWRLGGQSRIFVDNFRFTPGELCKDFNGNVFVTDQYNERVAVLDQRALSLHTVLRTPGEVDYLDCSQDTNQLCVLHYDKDHTRRMISTYDIGKSVADPNFPHESRQPRSGGQLPTRLRLKKKMYVKTKKNREP